MQTLAVQTCGMGGDEQRNRRGYLKTAREAADEQKRCQGKAVDSPPLQVMLRFSYCLKPGAAQRPNGRSLLEQSC